MSGAVVVVRDAGPADVDAVLRLMGVLGRPAPAPDPGPQRRVAAAWLADPEACVLLAERSGEPVGALALRMRARLGWASPEAWVPDLVVLPEARRRGVAGALLDAALARARAAGCHAVRLESGHDRAAAHPLYAAYGFRDTGVSYRLGL